MADITNERLEEIKFSLSLFSAGDKDAIYKFPDDKEVLSMCDELIERRLGDKINAE